MRPKLFKVVAQAREGMHVEFYYVGEKRAFSFL